MPRCPACYRRVPSKRSCPQHPEHGIVHRPVLKAQALTLSGYAIGQCLGGGGFSVVWAAVRTRDGNPVAIKVGQATTSKARRRFVHEAQTLALLGSPHVPALYDHGVLDDGRPFLVMELAAGQTLAEWLGHRSGPVGGRTPGYGRRCHTGQPASRSRRGFDTRRFEARQYRDLHRACDSDQITGLWNHAYDPDAAEDSGSAVAQLSMRSAARQARSRRDPRGDRWLGRIYGSGAIIGTATTGR